MMGVAQGPNVVDVDSDDSSSCKPRVRQRIAPWPTDESHWLAAREQSAQWAGPTGLLPTAGGTIVHLPWEVAKYGLPLPNMAPNYHLQATCGYIRSE
jgi:hypothetical protein